MRRSLAWLVAVPLMLAGSEAAHALAYRLAYPELHVRVHVLLVTGHGYLRWLPLVLGIAAAVVALSLLVTAVDAARGRAPRGLPAWAFALLPPLAFVVQEHLERLLHTGVFPWHEVGHADVRARTRAPASVRAARLRDGAAAAPHRGARRPRGRAASRPRGRGSPPPRPRAPASEPPLPRLALISSGLAKRGPPLLASA